MKIKNITLIVACISCIVLLGFKKVNHATNIVEDAAYNIGNAWWIIYYNDETNKKLLLSKVYNNNSYYCSNETRAAFNKWLVLNDYNNYPNSANTTCSYFTNKEDADKKREEIILMYKQQFGYGIVTVDFTYTEK